MRIPESWQDGRGNYSAFYERLDIAREQTVTLENCAIEVLFEEPRDGFTYGCAPPDVIRILVSAAKLLPAFPDIIAFRQPTGKQRQQNPVWGRFLYSSRLGRHKGTAIILEAQKLGAPLTWPKRMSIEDRAEYERLIADGHLFTDTKRSFRTNLNEETIRNTLLYRSFLHELGHLAQYHQNVFDKRTALDEDQAMAERLHFSRPASEREAYANAFAERIGQSLRSSGVIPFDALPY